MASTAALTKIDNVPASFANGSDGETVSKGEVDPRTGRELQQASGRALMEEGRRSLLDISEAAVKVTASSTRKAVSGDNPPPPRKPAPEAAVK